MVTGFLKKIFGSRNDRLLRSYERMVKAINQREAGLAALADSELRALTDTLKRRLADGETLLQLLPEAFAVVREAGKRTLGMRHFDVQLIGGMVLNDGKISEMRTGEGKTLMATLPSYLNALTGKGVHIVTVNDYLARRDAEDMGKLHGFLGLTVGVNLSQSGLADKQAAYAADITYGTNNEFGFDYLRDNMVYDLANKVQRGLSFAIVDEVDSILIDEARTPLIISGQAEGHTGLYTKMNHIIPMLARAESEEAEGDYWVDEKGHQVHITESGHEHAEAILVEAGILADGRSLYESSNINLMYHLNAALRAHALYHRDQQYVVQQGEVIIVDEFTGRLMPGRRWSEGLHQAVEAKEGVAIQSENLTMASITFQNYFRLYQKLSGMTGTADTEAFEFQHIYGLETVVVPTHRPMIRIDNHDMVFKTEDEKFTAILADIRDCQERGQPVLVGTTSIENSEKLSQRLQEQRLAHQVLNAKQHAKEADIVTQAGRPGMITIATNMAGRGTDIVLGGNISKQLEAIKNDPSLDEHSKKSQLAQKEGEWLALHQQVVEAGGLHIIGSERHESRRIDNQLRGRSGRQGDPGSSRFYLALEDPLLRIFAGDRIRAIMERLKMPEGEAIEHPLVSRSLESAQRKVEARNFDIRKQLLEYDDVSNDQRKVIYAQRNELLESEDISETVTSMRTGILESIVRQYIPAHSVSEQWDLAGLERELGEQFRLDMPITQWLNEDANLGDDDLLERVQATASETYRQKTEQVPNGLFRQYERNVMLQTLDLLWREHLSSLDHLRQGIHLRGYAQKNPKQEYKREAFELFELLLQNIAMQVTQHLLLVQIQSEDDVSESAPKQIEHVEYQHPSFAESLVGADNTADVPPPAPPPRQQPVRAAESVGRNEPCPCGSGKKYKHCHGALV